MARLLLIVSSCASAAGLSIGTSGINRRVACQQAAVAAAGMATTLLPSAAFAKEENTKEKDLLRETGKQMKALLDGKAAFIAALDAGEEVKVPAAIPFTTFQKLEKSADPEFMETAIDYAEAYRGFKDLVKLAKLTKQPVTLSIKEKGKPVEKKEVLYGDAPDSGLSTTKEYVDRALNELLGASLALDAAIGFMPK